MIVAAVVLLALILLAAVLLLVPYSVKLTFRAADALRVYVGIGELHIDVTGLLSGGGKKRKKQRKTRFDGSHFGSFGAQRTEKKKKSDARKEEKPKASLSDKLRMVSGLLTDTASTFGRHATLTIRRFRLRASLPEADRTAYLYGAMNAGLAAIMKLAGAFAGFEASEENIGVYADFASGTPDADIDVRVGMRGVRLLSFLARLAERLGKT